MEKEGREISGGFVAPKGGRGRVPIARARGGKSPAGRGFEGSMNK